jgi:hypothetical protein
MEECCSFGLRMVNIETAEKLQCMITAKVGKQMKIYLVTDIFIKFVSAEFLKTEPFVLGASRMGFVAKPVWCPSSKPIDFSIFGQNDLASNNTDPNNMVVTVLFGSGTIGVYGNDFYQWGCENA